MNRNTYEMELYEHGDCKLYSYAEYTLHNAKA